MDDRSFAKNLKKQQGEVGILKNPLIRIIVLIRSVLLVQFIAGRILGKRPETKFML